jgi:hypothetical protein
LSNGDERVEVWVNSGEPKDSSNQPCGEARAVVFVWRTIATFALAIFMEGVDQATERLL